jgi:hypothetical protein
MAIRSRYKDTNNENTSEGTVLSLWVPPVEFQTVKDNWGTHTVRQHEVGFLDILAARYFGAGMEQLWWVIAQANGIVDPDVDMYPGQRLRIPSRDEVMTFVSRSGRYE